MQNGKFHPRDSSSSASHYPLATSHSCSSIQRANVKVAIRHRPVIALKQDGPGAVRTVEARPCAALAEIADVLAVLFAEIDLQGLGLVLAFFVQALERGAIGFAVAHIFFAKNRPVIPDQCQLLALHRDVERLPLAWRLGMVFAGNCPFVERSAVVECQLGSTETVKHLDFEEPTVIDSRV